MLNALFAVKNPLDLARRAVQPRLVRAGGEDEPVGSQDHEPLPRHLLLHLVGIVVARLRATAAEFALGEGLPFAEAEHVLRVLIVCVCVCVCGCGFLIAGVVG